MSISSLRLQNIRSHVDSSYELTDGVNILIGPNACGKTTILEAISLLSKGSLPGSNTVKDILRGGADWHRIDLYLDHEERIFKYTEDREFTLGGSLKKRFSAGDIQPIVWFDPEELRLLRGSPTRRRDYFDSLLSQLNIGYRDSLNRYKRALLQRNTLLKKGGAADDVFVWNLRLVENAEVIFKARTELTNTINAEIQATYRELSGDTKEIQLVYETKQNKTSYADQLLHALQTGLERDRSLGYTSSGVHRDDFVFTGSGPEKLSRKASRGEIRTIMLSLKLLEMKKLTLATGKKPIILFDDVFSELDGARRKAFVGALKDHQTIITTTDADIVTKDFATHANIIAVS